MLAVLKKELKSYFYTPIGYIFISLFLVTTSFVFYNYTFTQGSLHFEYVIWDSTIILIFLVPIITMRMFAEEKKSGTDQLIITSPRSIISIVLGKFLAATLITVISALLMFIYYGILSRFGNVSIVEPLVAILGFMLLSMAYISFGMFTSAITEHQVISAIIPIAFFFILAFVNIDKGIFKLFSLTEMYQKFPQGIISLNETVGYVSFIFLFTSLTIIILQRRKSTK